MQTHSQQAASSEKNLSPTVGARFGKLDRERIERMSNHIHLSPGTWFKQQMLTILDVEEKRLGLKPLK